MNILALEQNSRGKFMSLPRRQKECYESRCIIHMTGTCTWKTPDLSDHSSHATLGHCFYEDIARGGPRNHRRSPPYAGLTELSEALAS